MKIFQGETQVGRELKVLFVAVTVGASVGAAAVVHAAPEAKKNECWGQITKQFAQTGTLGEHSSSPPGFVPGEGGRRGVGNVSKEDFGAVNEGGQGEHAIQVGAVLGFTCDMP